MLKRMHLKKFTVFNDQMFEFSNGLNVIVGENSAGKSHILKLAYAMLCEHGVQIVIATNSLFLLREIEILQADRNKKQPAARFFGLMPTQDGTTVMQGNHIDDIGNIAVLHESLLQSDRYLAMAA